MKVKVPGSDRFSFSMKVKGGGSERFSFRERKLKCQIQKEFRFENLSQFQNSLFENHFLSKIPFSMVFLSPKFPSRWSKNLNLTRHMVENFEFGSSHEKKI